MKLSIIIPMYNAERFINLCIDSILQQTFQDFEIIIIDDCSTDQSFEIVAHYKDPRIKIFKQIKNSGESSSRNFGLKVASGKYVYFMDHDDLILPKTLEILYLIAEDSQAEIVYMNSWYEVDENFVFSDRMNVVKYENFNPTPREISTDLIERLQTEYMNRDVEVSPWMKIQRRDFILKHGIYFPKVTRDGDGLFNFAELCYVNRALVVDVAGYIHRNYSQQTLGLPAETQLQQTILSLPETVRFMDEIMDNFRDKISMENRLSFKKRQIIHMFKSFITRSYGKNLSLETIDEIVHQNISSLINENLVRTMFNVLTDQIALNETQQKELESIKNSKGNPDYDKIS